MKIKNITKLKDKLESVTDSIDLHIKGDAPTTIRYDVYEEMFFLCTNDKEIALTETEAKRLKSVLNSML